MTGGNNVGPDLNTTAYRSLRLAIKMGVAPAATLGIRSSIRIGRPISDNGAAPLSPLNTIGRPVESLMVHTLPSVKLFMIQLAPLLYVAGSVAHRFTRSCQVKTPAGVALLVSHTWMPEPGVRMPVGLPLPSPISTAAANALRNAREALVSSHPSTSIAASSINARDAHVENRNSSAF